MRSLRERNQLLVAVLGTALAAIAVAVSVNLGNLPLLHRASGYHAQFANADGLRSGDDVRVEGLRVGEVTGVRVEGAHVRVDFTARRDLALGEQSRASIEVATVLGDVYLQIESAGSRRLRAGATIPVERTTVPETLITAFGQLGAFGDQTDLPALRTSLATLAATMSGIAPGEARAALSGLADVSRTLAGKRRQIGQILDSASAITGTLDDNSGALVQVLTQSDAFLALLHQREAVIDRLLRSTSELGAQLRKLMRKNASQLAPLLRNLDAVGAVLAADKDKLRQAVVSLGDFSVNVTNATGAGPWLDLLSPVAVTPDNVILACGPKPDSASGPCG